MAALAVAALGFLLAARPAWGRELVVHRPIFGQQAERQAGPPAKLVPGREVEVRAQPWRVEGADRLRVESPDPDTVVVMRIEPKEPAAATLVLTVIVLSRKARFDFQYRHTSQILTGGRIATQRRFQVGEGLTTDLAGAPGEVAEIRLQDDAGAELRLRQEANELILRVIPPHEGGSPSGGALPYYQGQTLTFLDYDLLGGGGTGNFYFEAVLFDHFALMANTLESDDESVVLARGVVRAQVARWARFGVTLEGGAAFYSLDPEDASDENDGAATWVLGTTGNFRFGNWGARLHAATVNGATLTVAMAGWQFSRSFGGMVEWQSFQGLSGFGAGLSLRF